MTLPAPVLDHVVINVLGGLDEAAERYRRLGFQLTERGHHTLGSSNHLAIFGSDYLELLGFEAGKAPQRADLWQHPPGLTGLVFKTTDSQGLYEGLVERGVPVEAPVEFSRPVALQGGAQDARFRVVRLSPAAVPNGRAFFCHHFTPELVWRKEWRAHANGVTGIAEFVIAAREPERTGALYGRIFGASALARTAGGLALQAGTATVLFLTPEAVRERFGDVVEASAEGSDRMVALSLRTRSREAARRALAAGGIPDVRDDGLHLVVPAAQAAGVALAFSE